MTQTFIRSRNSVHALAAQLRKGPSEPWPWAFAAFMIHFFSSCAASAFFPSAISPAFGISWTAARNSEASLNGTEKTNVVSCEIGDRGFDVEGKTPAEQLLGIGTASTSGALCGELFDKEPGNTKVINAICSAAYHGRFRFFPNFGRLEKTTAALTYLIDAVDLAIIIYSPLPGGLFANFKPSASLDQRAEVCGSRSIPNRCCAIKQASFQETNVGGTCQQSDEDYSMDWMCTCSS